MLSIVSADDHLERVRTRKGVSGNGRFVIKDRIVIDHAERDVHDSAAIVPNVDVAEAGEVLVTHDLPLGVRLCRGYWFAYLPGGSLTVSL